MQTKKQLYTDVPVNGGGSNSSQPVLTTAIPQADTDFMDVSKNVSKAWLAAPEITLKWKKAPDFAKEVQDYEFSLGNRKSTGSLRPGQALNLKQLDKRIDDGVKMVKIYIEKKYKPENAPAQYARFGITKENKSFILNRDRNNRRDALKLMIAAIEAEGFGNEEYGTAFWKDMQANYSDVLNTSNNTSGDVSTKAATKNEQKKAIRKVLSSLLLLLKANYPDTYKSVYREWGWQKESY